MNTLGEITQNRIDMIQKNANIFIAGTQHTVVWCALHEMKRAQHTYCTPQIHWNDNVFFTLLQSNLFNGSIMYLFLSGLHDLPNVVQHYTELIILYLATREFVKS